MQLRKSKLGLKLRLERLNDCDLWPRRRLAGRKKRLRLPKELDLRRSLSSRRARKRRPDSEFKTRRLRGPGPCGLLLQRQRPRGSNKRGDSSQRLPRKKGWPKRPRKRESRPRKLPAKLPE